MRKDVEFILENDAAGFWEGYEKLIWISLGAVSAALERVAKIIFDILTLSGKVTNLLSSLISQKWLIEAKNVFNIF